MGKPLPLILLAEPSIGFGRRWFVGTSQATSQCHFPVLLSPLPCTFSWQVGNRFGLLGSFVTVFLFITSNPF